MRKICIKFAQNVRPICYYQIWFPRKSSNTSKKVQFECHFAVSNCDCTHDNFFAEQMLIFASNNRLTRNSFKSIKYRNLGFKNPCESSASTAIFSRTSGILSKIFETSLSSFWFSFWRVSVTFWVTDLSGVPDLSWVPDLSGVLDGCVVPDLSWVLDLSWVPDMSWVPDVSWVPELSGTLSTVPLTCLRLVRVTSSASSGSIYSQVGSWQGRIMGAGWISGSGLSETISS